MITEAKRPTIVAGTDGLRAEYARLVLVSAFSEVHP